MKPINFFMILVLSFLSFNSLSAQRGKVLWRGIVKTIEIVKKSKPAVRTTTKVARRSNYELFSKEEESESSNSPLYRRTNALYPSKTTYNMDAIRWAKTPKTISQQHRTSSKSKDLENWMRQNSKRN